MVLDSLTVLFALAPVSLMVGVFLFVVWNRDRSEPGLWLWAVSLFVRAPAFVLLSLRGAISDLLSIALANALMLVGVGLAIIATRALGRRSTSPWLAFAPVALWGLICATPALYGNDENRVVALTLIQACCSGVIAYEFLRCKVGSRALCLTLSCLIASMTTVQLVRVGLILVADEPYLLDGSNASLAATIYLQLLAVFLGGLISMALFCGARLRALQQIADEDSLTGAFNREAFRDRAEASLAMARQTRDDAVLLAIDLDRFKALNDLHGHAEGDRILMEFGRRLKALMPAGAVLGRIGGDEFAVFLRGEAARHAASLAARICGVMLRGSGGDPAVLPILVTASAGLAQAVDGETLETLMQRADMALYDAKRKGRDQVSLAAGAAGPGLLWPRAVPASSGLPVPPAVQAPRPVAG
ncbi:diguanylate cyclase [Microvirga tunisiensis]|uniref:diguanylate cyclase n=1 Tax=Pannonibacter tanglangensis TaxID=2750084 RepID=A0A7X5F090_9HYPH|nr:GGDEF domain-containing protein [Pannonibacter sp. XCT-53]NBN77376.1 diguanylate cyclase [Pannonibacter sp. XCT-53]